MKRGLVAGFMIACATLLAGSVSVTADALSLNQEISVDANESQFGFESTSGSFKITVEGCHLIDHITEYQTNGMAVLGVQCAVENVDFADLLLQNYNLSTYNISQYVRVIDEEGFDCEFYNLDDSNGDGKYSVYKEIPQGSKARVSLTYYIDPNAENITVEIDDSHRISFKLDANGEGTAVETPQNDQIETTSKTENVEKKTDNSQDPIPVFDQEGIKIYVTGFKSSDPYNTKLLFAIENLNHHDINVHTSNSKVVVNGLMLDSSMYQEVKSGRKANSSIDFYPFMLEEASIDKIKDISFSLEIYDANTYNVLFTSNEVFLTISDEGMVSSRTVYTDKESIRKVQELLNKIGLECGTADGIAGKKTNAAILKFEKMRGLPETTDITLELITELENAAQ